MVAVFLREEGGILNLTQSYKEKYPYLEEYINILGILLKELKDSKNIDVEVNLVEYGRLGSELLLDNRLNTEMINKDFDSIKNLNAIVFYYVEVYGSLLLEEYREQKICYIQLQQTYTINMLRIALHELHHFLDPFTPSEWQTPQDNGLTFMEYEKTIKAYIRLGLNEYYANLFAFSKSLYFINDMFQDKYYDFIIDKWNRVLIEKIPSYIIFVGEELNNLLAILREGEIKNVPFQNPKAELIQFLWSKFYISFYRFLGGWKAYEDKELNTSLIQESWDSCISEIKEFEFDTMIMLLESFKELMLEDFESEDEIVERVELLFLKYYRESLDSDFSSFL